MRVNSIKLAQPGLPTTMASSSYEIIAEIWPVNFFSMLQSEKYSKKTTA
jgi:hypothetical protein